MFSSTITAYSTTQQTETVTIPDTVTDIVHDTVTSVVHDTASVDQTITVTVTPTTSESQAPFKAKRTASADLPDYATACSGLDRFASACSCIGVTAKTSYASTPSVTLTWPVTETSWVSVTQIVETVSVTVEDATITQTTTDTTVTNQAVATVTATPPPQSVTGTVQLYINGVAQPYYITQFTSGSLIYAEASSDPTSAIQLTVDTSGHLLVGSDIALGDGGNTLNLQLFFAPPGISTARIPYVCSVDPSYFISCYTSDPSVPTQFLWRSNNFIYAAPLSVATNTGYTFISLKFVA